MKIAKVVANPFSAFCADGVPQGVVGLPGAAGVYIGARLDPIASEKAGTKRFYFPLDRDGKRRVVDIEVSNANVRADIARAVNDGSLLAADEETARCFITGDYLPFEKALALEEAKAIEAHKAFRGDSIPIQPVPVEAMKSPDSDDEPKAPAQKGIRLGAALTLHPHEGQ